jgi:hypothetical protein
VQLSSFLEVRRRRRQPPLDREELKASVLVRVRTRELVAELRADLRGRGLFVLERGRNECEVRLLNPVSERTLASSPVVICIRLNCT